jgi:hypothetical protein
MLPAVRRACGPHTFCERDDLAVRVILRVNLGRVPVACRDIHCLNTHDKVLKQDPVRYCHVVIDDLRRRCSTLESLDED